VSLLPGIYLPVDILHFSLKIALSESCHSKCQLTEKIEIEIDLKTFKGKQKDNLSEDFQRKRKGQFIERLSMEKKT
jgi:hypothetical protein